MRNSVRLVVAGLLSIAVVGVLPAQIASAGPKSAPQAMNWCCR